MKQVPQNSLATLQLRTARRNAHSLQWKLYSASDPFIWPTTLMGLIYRDFRNVREDLSRIIKIACLLYLKTLGAEVEILTNCDCLNVIWHAWTTLLKYGYMSQFIPRAVSSGENTDSVTALPISLIKLHLVYWPKNKRDAFERDFLFNSKHEGIELQILRRKSDSAWLVMSISSQRGGQSGQCRHKHLLQRDDSEYGEAISRV